MENTLVVKYTRTDKMLIISVILFFAVLFSAVIAGWRISGALSYWGENYQADNYWLFDSNYNVAEVYKTEIIQGRVASFEQKLDPTQESDLVINIVLPGDIEGEQVEINVKRDMPLFDIRLQTPTTSRSITYDQLLASLVSGEEIMIKLGYTNIRSTDYNFISEIIIYRLYEDKTPIPPGIDLDN